MKKILVVAGNQRQFEIWKQQQPRELLRFTTYLHDIHQLRGLGPESVERLELVGSWWTSELYRNQGSWRELQMRLGVEVQQLREQNPPDGAERQEALGQLQAWPPDGAERHTVNMTSRAFSILYETGEEGSWPAGGERGKHRRVRL